MSTLYDVATTEISQQFFQKRGALNLFYVDYTQDPYVKSKEINSCFLHVDHYFFPINCTY
jgi:hypothetical protein